MYNSTVARLLRWRGCSTSLQHQSPWPLQHFTGRDLEHMLKVADVINPQKQPMSAVCSKDQ